MSISGDPMPSGNLAEYADPARAPGSGLLEVPGFGVAVIDLSTGLHLDVNPTYCRLTGCLLTELRKKTVAELICPEDRGAAAAGVAELRKASDGRWLRVVRVEVPGGQGQVLIEDVTSHKVAELEWA